jgi:hypothetical protein
MKAKCSGQYVDLTAMKQGACDITIFGTYWAPTCKIQTANMHWACSSDEDHEGGTVVDNYLKHCVDNFRMIYSNRMFDRRSTPCPVEVRLVLYLRISSARVIPLRSFNLPSDHFPCKVQDPNCTAVNGNYNMPQWNHKHCLYCIPTAHLTFRQQHVVLQHVPICWISSAKAHCPKGLCVSHTSSFTVLCVVT